jgi:hypothetical protein
MPRLMSVAYTEPAVRDRTKTVTRRAGWSILRPGSRLTLCRKVMGRRAGEPLVRIVDVEVIDVRREPLSDLLDAELSEYGTEEMKREGFPGMDPVEFVATYFTEAQGIQPDAMVTRIEWRYLEDTAR